MSVLKKLLIIVFVVIIVCCIVLLVSIDHINDNETLRTIMNCLFRYVVKPMAILYMMLVIACESIDIYTIIRERKNEKDYK